MTAMARSYARHRLVRPRHHRITTRATLAAAVALIAVILIAMSAPTTAATENPAVAAWREQVEQMPAPAPAPTLVAGSATDSAGKGQATRTAKAGATLGARFQTCKG